MQTGTVWLKMDKFGNNIRCANVTPAEVIYLRSKFEKLAGEDPVKHLHEVKEVERSNADEQTRLRLRFGGDRIDELFGKALPSFPKTFDEMDKKVEEPGEHPDQTKQAKKPLAGLPGKSGKGFAESTTEASKTLGMNAKSEPVLAPAPELAPSKLVTK